LIPFLLGLIILLFFNHSYVTIIYLTLTEISVGLGSTVKTAVIAKIYGTKSLGAIRSAFSTTIIFGTSISSLLFGYLIDNGFNFLHIISGGIGSYDLKVERKNYAKYWKILKKKKSLSLIPLTLCLKSFNLA